MSWPHDCAYGIECPNEGSNKLCDCGEEIIEGEYINELLQAEGCTECIKQADNDGEMRCTCKGYSEATEYIFFRSTGRGADVIGCSECLKFRAAY